MGICKNPALAAGFFVMW